MLDKHSWLIMMLINPFPFQNSKPTPAGFCKHTRSVYQYLFKVDQGHNFIAQCSTKTLFCWHQAGSKSSLGDNGSSCLQGREQRHSSFMQKRCTGQNRRHHLFFLCSQPFTFDYAASLNHCALTSWDGLPAAPCRKGASYFSYAFLTWGLRLWESGLGWDMHVPRREREVHILEFELEVEDE